MKAEKFGFNVHCSRYLLETTPMPGESMRSALNRLSKDEKRNAMIWLTRGGPFLEDFRRHDSDTYLECRDDIVTDSTVGEAAFRKFNDIDSCLISARPSDWNYDPVVVVWRRESEGLDNRVVELPNWRDSGSLEIALRGLANSVQSWNDLKLISVKRFKHLSFADDSFNFLDNGMPFVESAAKRMLVLFGILDRFADAFNENGTRTTEGHQLYRDYFTGDRALFSDSSATEKRSFKKELMFLHPADRSTRRPFTWHGKVNNPVMRFHFSWPIRHREPVYIVYVGPKLTRK